MNYIVTDSSVVADYTFVDGYGVIWVVSVKPTGKEIDDDTLFRGQENERMGR